MPSTAATSVRESTASVVRKALLASRFRAMAYSGTVVDSEGRTQDIYFSRPVEKLIRAKITLTKIAKLYVGDDAVAEKVALWGNTLGLGHDIFSSAVGANAFATGVVNVSSTLISIHPVDPPVSSAALTIGVRDLPIFSSDRVEVISTNTTP